mmetsp:Transcript_6415/g.13462  ORF Transcript_6415/g.13462 Transcript_6415/m.13462 type:complete len:242 (-) Transcript_6415:131-856(-)
MPLQLGCDDSWVDSDGNDLALAALALALALQPSVQLPCVEHIGQLGLAVGPPGLVLGWRVHLLLLENPLARVAHVVRAARDVDHAALRGPWLVGRPFHVWEEELGEEEVAEVVGGPLELEAVLGAGEAGQRHDAGVVDEQVQVLPRPLELVGEALHALERAEVQLHRLHRASPLAHRRDLGSDLPLDPVRPSALFLAPSARQYDLAPSAGERTRRRKADARVGARHNRRAPAAVVLERLSH